LTAVTTNAPFWSAPHEHYAAPLPEETDIVIIGGGITGVSLLHHLAKRRRKALLVERDHIAAGASGRNAGFLLAGVADNYATAVRTYGRERAREIWAFTLDNHDAVAAAVKNVDVDHNRFGSVILAASDDERAQLEESAELLLEDGFHAKLEGSTLFNPRDGEVNPTALVQALAEMAPRGVIRERTNVSGIVPFSRGVYVHIGNETCEAGAVILATNAWTSALAPTVKITPQRAQMLATAPVERVISQKPTYSNFGYRYWRQLASGVLLIGGWRDTSRESEMTFDDKPTAALQERIETFARGLGADVPITNRWAGTMGFTADGLPIVGPVEGMPHVYACAGYNGHGMGFAFLSAKRLVDSL
jgi:glycine/D-amino acid oxidase-like deaminating enzyme